MKATDDELARAIRERGGVLSEVAKACNMTYRGVAKRIAASEQLKALVDEEREKLLDLAEVGLRRATAKGSAWAVKFVLSTIGRGRGYARTVRLEGETTARILLRFPDNGRRLKPLQDSPTIAYEKPHVDFVGTEPPSDSPTIPQAETELNDEPAQSTTRAETERTES